MCPNTDPPGWTQSSNVKYYTGAGGFTTQELNQIKSALTNWSYHNLVLNCSDVYFLEDSSLSTAVLKIESNAGHYVPLPDSAAVTDRSRTTSTFFQAKVTFYWGAYIGTTPAWNRNGSASYYRFIKKIMLHEVGHTMAIDHPGSEASRVTVMNGWSGTNESGNHMPTTVQSFDDGRINTVSQYGSNCAPLWY